MLFLDFGGVNYYFGVQSVGLVKLVVVYLDVVDVIVLVQQVCYFVVGKDLCVVFVGVEYIGCGEVKWVDGIVWDLYCVQQCWVDGGFLVQCFLW